MNHTSTPLRRAVRSHIDAKVFGGDVALWHGYGCTCAACVAAGYACACGDPHCDNHKLDTDTEV